MNEKVLIAEDDSDIAELLSLYLNSDGFITTNVSNGKDALEELKKEIYSVLLVDIMMPEVNGYDLIKELRTFSQIPVIVISAKAADEDRVLGLNIGADVYITKPFNPLEVVAYVKASIRRNNMVENTNKKEQNTVLKVGDLEFDTSKYILKKDGKVLSLTASELKIVCMMMESPERIFTKAQIYERISGDSYMNDDSTVMVHISNIRQKIEDVPSNPKYIKTVRGLGYKIEKV